MYLRILGKDLRQKKMMNAILLAFIILAAAFIAGSAGNVTTVFTALDRYFEMAGVPDYWFAATDPGEVARFEAFAKEHGYVYQKADLMQIDPKDVLVEGEEFSYGNTLCLSTVEGSRVFDSDAREIKEVGEGEIYVASNLFCSEEYAFREGGTVSIASKGVEKEFVLQKAAKDALFGSPMIGMARFLVSKKDYDLFYQKNKSICYMVSVYTEDPAYPKAFADLELDLVMNEEYSTVKLMYLMDLLIAAVMLAVSVCLILISLVILHFTIRFTVTEDFREIGVMKAIGIKNSSIRGLYIIKYFAVAVVGSAIGFALSFPFGALLLSKSSQNIIISNEGNALLQLLCAISTAAFVALFCYYCTRNVKKFSPIDAIRNGETGERYRGRGVVHLSRSKLRPVFFLAVNDILSAPKRYLAMALIFILGTLLVIIPVNSINTLRSDKLLSWFNMADSDHVISQETLLMLDGNNRKLLEDGIAEVEDFLSKRQIQAEVFQEAMFRMGISFGEKKTSSLAFLGIGAVTADQYAYIEGTPPQDCGEVAISYVNAEQIGAGIGDEVEIKMGGEGKTYLVTALTQSLNNMGEGIRFYQKEPLDDAFMAGSFGIQVRYADHPGKKELEERKGLLAAAFPDAAVYTAGEYVSNMIGDSAGQLEDIKALILLVVLCIHMLVALLMEKSFLTKEKGEIAILKAIGFRNGFLILWQTMRIGLVLAGSVLLGVLLSKPISGLTVGPIFQMMGAYKMELEVLPFEVYAQYPLLMLAAVLLAAFIAAQGLRKIKSDLARE